jgi:LCP family protein required for cell wall assembly
MKKTVVWLRWMALVGVLLVLFLSYRAAVSPVARALRSGTPVVVAVMGTDLAEKSPHSDTLMVAVYHPRGGRLDLLSIPRDTKIDLRGFRFRRINEVFAFHFAQTGDAHRAARHVCEAVGELFEGIGAELKPGYYVQVDFDGFRRVLDRLGGVTVSVDEPMDYDDRAGAFHVHLTTGVHHLDGDRALGFVRFRGKSGDRGRILRQMEFVHAVVDRLASPAIVWRGPRALWEAGQAIRTNLSFLDMVFFSLEARRMTSRRLNTVLLPGRPRGAVWEMDAERTAFVLRQLAGTGPIGERAVEMPTPAEVDVSTAAAGGLAPAVSAPEEGKTTVKVWNASGRAGLAITVVRRLRAAGFDVVEWGNYSARQKKTRAIDRSGRFDRAGAVAESLGVASLYSDVDPALRYDVDVVLGDDFK